MPDDNYNTNILDFLRQGPTIPSSGIVDPTQIESMTHQQTQPPDATSRVVGRMQQWPGMAAQHVIDALKAGPELTRDFMQGQTSSDDPAAIQRAFGVAGTLAAPAPATAARGSAGIFGGKLAQGADLSARDTAMALQKARTPPTEIFDKTGWFQGKDGQWRFEISDKGMETKPLPNANKSDAISGPLDAFVDHDKLFQAYPNSRHLNVKIDPEIEGATYLHGNQQILLGGKIGKEGLTDRQQDSLIHELQHHIQGTEGFGSGGSVGRTHSNVMNVIGGLLANPHLSPEQFDKVLDARSAFSRGNADVPWEMYKRIPGEVEARNASNRFSQGKFGVALPPLSGYDPYRHSRYPWASEDVPRLLQYDYLRKGIHGMGRRTPHYEP
jgi:hypothetical protein